MDLNFSSACDSSVIRPPFRMTTQFDIWLRFHGFPYRSGVPVDTVVPYRQRAYVTRRRICRSPATSGTIEKKSVTRKRMSLPVKGMRRTTGSSALRAEWIVVTSNVIAYFSSSFISWSSLNLGFTIRLQDVFEEVIE